MFSNILYIDPASGSALIAIILASLVGAGMYVKSKWYSIRYRNKNNKKLP